MTSTIGIKLDEAIKQRLHLLGNLRDRSPHWLMKHAIVEFLEREERYEREKKEDEARYEEYLRTGKGYSMQQMSAWIDDVTKRKRKKVVSRKNPKK